MHEITKVLVIFVLACSAICKVLDVTNVWHALFNVVKNCCNEDIDSDGVMLHAVTDDTHADCLKLLILHAVQRKWMQCCLAIVPVTL